MDKMEWALWSLGYLANQRNAIREDFDLALREVSQRSGSNRESWHGSCKNIIATLYHFSMEFVQDTTIPCEGFASPDVFETELTGYRTWLTGMVEELEREDKKFREENEVDGPPYLIPIARRQVDRIAAAIDYVITKRPQPTNGPLPAAIELINGLARRFHEAALSLKTHPHGGKPFEIKDEWDCQYIFRSILAAYVSDIRDEEWNPSVAGSSSRCEFFLKPFKMMIELKYVRKAEDAKKIKGELSQDFVDYGGNPQVNRILCLVYDPTHALKNPVALETDLSGPKAGLEHVDVIISPPRIP